jgi:hypothetical protein
MRDMAAAYCDRIAYYREHHQCSPQDAVARTDGSASTDFMESILARPPEDVSWFQLHVLAEKDRTLAVRRWDEICHAALGEVQGKERAAKAVESWSSDAWQRAQFFALCRELEDGWQPQNGIERQLLDTMAQAQSGFIYWLTVLTKYTTFPVSNADRKEGKWAPPRVSEAEAIDQAAAMMDRFNRVFLRTLRALRDLRRYAPATVVVQNAGQVNVGSQQVNMAPAKQGA